MKDDRLVFTEDNPDRELNAAAGLAAASVALQDLRPEDVGGCAEGGARRSPSRVTIAPRSGPRVFALAELYLATKDRAYLDKIVGLKGDIVADMWNTGWPVGEVIGDIHDKDFTDAMTKAVADFQAKMREASKETPYGVPYKPNIWGAGWNIQELAVHQHFFRKGWPALTAPDIEVNALNFDLGVHPGENTESFVSGVGAQSATVAYGVNRADWSYIPGGVISGTALIRPDLPELKVWPYFWQQTEYVMGGGATNYMFLVLDTNALYAAQKE